MKVNGNRPERRDPANTRTRALVESLLERVAELEQQRGSDRKELHELATLLGRLEAAIDLEAADTAPPPFSSGGPL